MTNSVRHVKERKGEHVVVHRWRPRHCNPMPQRHLLEPPPRKPELGYGWVWVILGGAAIAMLITFPVFTIVAGVVIGAIAWMVNS